MRHPYAQNRIQAPWAWNCLPQTVSHPASAWIQNVQAAGKVFKQLIAGIVYIVQGIAFVQDEAEVKIPQKIGQFIIGNTLLHEIGCGHRPRCATRNGFPGLDDIRKYLMRPYLAQGS